MSGPNWKKIISGYNVIDEEYGICRDDKDITVILVGNAIPFKKGRTFGPAENCYPDEGGYCEDITSFNPVSGEEIELTEDELDVANEYLYNKYCESCEPDYDYDPPDYFD